MPPGQMHIEDGVLQLDVAQQELDRAQVGAGLDQMGRVRMAQGVGGDALPQRSAQRRGLTGLPDDLGGDPPCANNL